MRQLPYELYSVEQTRELDRIAIEQHNIPAATLMARAGAAALSAIHHHWPQAQQLTIVCGSGNNGGDGYELARQALAKGYQASVYEVGELDKMSDETKAARQALIAAKGVVHRFKGQLPDVDVLVDGLFGTGLDRAISGHYAQAIDAINKCHDTPVLALDIPSGIHANTGQVLGGAVNAAVTISFIGLNVGLFNGVGPDYCGNVCFDNLDIPATIYKAFTPQARRLSLEHDAAEHLMPRQRTAHKGSFGHLLVIGGDHGMSGAARIAAEAGARVGAGLTSVATRTEHARLLNLTRPEIMCHAVESSADITSLLNSATTLTLGPGLGQTDWSQALFDRALQAKLPMVVDADGLNLLSQSPQHYDNWVLTPHPGEAARLLGLSTKELQADRFTAVEQLYNRYGGVIVLKGAGTLVYSGQQPIALSTLGNPGMATGGMGDALAGIIGGLLAQGLRLLDAAKVGVILHAMAADKAAEQDGERGMLAMDLMPHLRHLANLRN